MIALTPNHPSNEACESAHVWPLVVVSSSDNPNEDARVFVFRRNPGLYDDDLFWSVANIDSLGYIPPDGPSVGNPFYRSDKLAFNARSVSERDNLINTLNAEVERLNESLSALASMAQDEEVHFEMTILTRKGIKHEQYEGTHAWPMEVSANTPEGAPDAIFVYHASGDDDPYEGDVFEAVASVQQIRDLPENAPAHDDNGQLVPYYRKAKAVFMTRSPSEAEELWQAIIDDVDDLTRSLAAVDRAATQETHTSTGD